jgi:hypothetical protein
MAYPRESLTQLRCTAVRSPSLVPPTRTLRPTAGRLSLSTRIHASRYDIPICRPASKIEPCLSISSSSLILPGPIARPTVVTVQQSRLAFDQHGEIALVIAKGDGVPSLRFRGIPVKRSGSGNTPGASAWGGRSPKGRLRGEVSDFFTGTRRRKDRSRPARRKRKRRHDGERGMPAGFTNPTWVLP